MEEIVDTPSVSGNEEACAEKLKSFFKEYDREAWIDQAGNIRAPGNSILLTSHIDTVPGDLRVERRDGHLHGRGSVDAKGPSVAMAVAAVETGASFAGVVQEETDSSGAKFLIDDRNSPEFLVNGEPTGADSVALGYRGSILGEYKTEEKLFHSSRPENNAIQNAIKEWHGLEASLPDGSGFESIDVKPLEIKGGEEEGLITTTSIHFQARVPPEEKVKNVKSMIEDELDGEINFSRSVPGVMISPRTELARSFRSAAREVTGRARMVRKTGTCDMNRYSEAWDAQMVTYGPGNSEFDHTPEEKIDLEDFNSSIKVLNRVIEFVKS